MKRSELKWLTLSLVSLAVLSCSCAMAQTATDSIRSKSKWYFGVAGGYHYTKMDFSDINEEIFPDSKGRNSGVFSIFVQGEFGKERNFAVRPQLSILNRGGKLTGIGSADDAYEADEISDIWYSLHSRYIDVRLPLIYNFGKASSKIRPYVFIAPVLGFPTGGDIKLQADMDNNSYSGYKVDLSDANISKTYFAGQVGAGLKFAIPVAGDVCYLGIEAAYEHGFTDTYGSKEKDGDANDLVKLFNSNYKIEGTRKFSGFEVSALLTVPFSIFSPKVQPAPEPVPEPVAAKPVPVVEEKPCYTLEELNDLMDRTQGVEGKTICAVDALTIDFAKSTIKPESYGYLDKLATTLIRTGRRIEVKGHTDNVGSDDFNMNLSRERAEAVVEYLVSKGVNRNKLTYSYYGMTRPLSDNSSEEGRAMNRRVEFTILNNF